MDYSELFGRRGKTFQFSWLGFKCHAGQKKKSLEFVFCGKGEELNELEIYELKRIESCWRLLWPLDPKCVVHVLWSKYACHYILNYLKTWLDHEYHVEKTSLKASRFFNSSYCNLFYSVELSSQSSINGAWPAIVSLHCLYSPSSNSLNGNGSSFGFFFISGSLFPRQVVR